MPVKMVLASGVSGELSWDELGGVALELGDYSYGKATAASVKERTAADKHTRIHLHDILRMIGPLLRSDGPLHCQWKADDRWGDFLYVECKQMPLTVEVYSGGMLRLVGDWIKIHFQNKPGPSRSKICLAVMMAFHPRLGAASALQVIPEELLRHLVD